MGELIAKVEQSITTRKLLADGQKVVVAVSGGLDSTVLLHVFYRLAPAYGWQLIVAHFNHQLRGRDSDGDEQFVQKTSKALNLEVRTGRGDVTAAAAQYKTSIE